MPNGDVPLPSMCLEHCGFVRRRHTAPATLHQRAFTLIELLIVLAIMATLMSIVAPRYFTSIDKAKEAALKSDLRILRESIDKFHADTGRYPENLRVLVSGRYILAVPADPITERDDSWIISPVPDGAQPGVYDVHSGAPGVGANGHPYKVW